MIEAIPSPAVPEWLQRSRENAKVQGLDQISEEEIEAEIAAARKARREKQSGQ